MIRLARPQFDDEEIAAVVSVLRSGNLVQGAQVAAFEAAVCETLGVEFAVACSSGTAALHLALLALDVGPGDEIIVPDFTFPATANVVALCGATAKIVEVDPRTFNVDPEAMAAAITPQTKALMPVHLFGLPADMTRIESIAADAGLPIIEDAACALGARHWNAQGESIPTGTQGLMACWSFHPRKVITTGEGGMITTRDPAVAERLRALRNHGATREKGFLVYHQPGPNYRMTDMQGALGVGQMKRLQGFIDARRALAAAYDARLAHTVGVSTPYIPPGAEPTYQAYVLRLDPEIDRAALMQRLVHRGVECSIGTYALHAQPYYQNTGGLQAEDFPNGQALFDHTLALPLHPGLSDDDVKQVVRILEEELPQ